MRIHLCEQECEILVMTDSAGILSDTWIREVEDSSLYTKKDGSMLLQFCETDYKWHIAGAVDECNGAYQLEGTDILNATWSKIENVDQTIEIECKNIFKHCIANTIILLINLFS